MAAIKEASILAVDLNSETKEFDAKKLKKTALSLSNFSGNSLTTDGTNLTISTATGPVTIANFKKLKYLRTSVESDWADIIASGAISYVGEHISKKGKVTGTNYSDFINFSAEQGKLTINSGKGNDTIYGGTNNDTINGGEGNDFIYGSSGADTITGGKGVNVIKYSSLEQMSGDKIKLTKSENLVIDISDLADATAEYIVSGNDVIVEVTSGGNKSTFTLVGFGKKDGLSNKTKKLDDTSSIMLRTASGEENLKTAFVKSDSGTWHDDIIDKSGYENTKGKGLTIKGAAGTDIITGTNYADTIKGGDGSDMITGGKGDDKLYGEGGYNKFVFEAGDGNDTVYSGKNEDTLVLKNIGLEDIIGKFSNGTTKKTLNDLTLNYTENDSITIKDYYAKDKKGKSKNTVNRITVNEGTFLIDDVMNPDLIIKGSGEINGNDNNNTIFGSDTSDAIHANGGDDVVAAKAGNDTIYGDSGNNTLIGGTGDDNIYGGTGADTFQFSLGDGNDTVYNATSVDKIEFAGTVDNLSYSKNGNDFKVTRTTGSVNDSVTLKNYFANGDRLNQIVANNENVDLNNITVTVTGSGAINGTDWKDVITGSVENDTINGGDGDDTITGGTGNDIIDGGSGINTFIFNNGDGKDVIKKGDGTDTIAITTTSNIALIHDMKNNDLVIDYGVSYGDDTITLKDYFVNNSHSVKKVEINGENKSLEELLNSNGLDTYGTENADNITGGAYNDTIYGNEGDDTIEGGAGNDCIVGNDGNDTIRGGAGDDWLVGESGNDTLDGGDGNDYIYGGSMYEYSIDSGNNTINGGAGSDTIYGNLGNDEIHGGEGNDYIYGIGGTNFLYGDEGNDYIEGGVGDDTIEGGVGNDNIYGGEGNDTIDGGTGNDYLEGDEGNDTIHGGEGIDEIYGIGGTNFLYGDDGDDKIWGGVGNDTIEGGNGDDYIDGGAGNDIIYGHNIFGGTGNNTIYGGAGDDYIFGGNGDDYIEGEEGIDEIYGGDGNDEIYGNNGDDYINGGAGNDKLNGGAGTNTFVFNDGSGQDTINNSSGTDTVRLNTKSTLKFTHDMNNDDLVMSYGTGTDKITFKNYYYYNSGSHSVKTVINDDENLSLDDTIAKYGLTAIGTYDKDWIYGSSGNDTINGYDGNDNIYGYEGNDIIEGEDGDDTIYGDDGDDKIYGGAGVDTIRGGAGNDIIEGNDGNDTIYDNDGDDIIYGGKGDDTIISTGSGADTIYHSAGDGNDTIYVKNGDIIVLNGETSIDNLSRTRKGNDTVIKRSNNETITIKNYYTTNKAGTVKINDELFDISDIKIKIISSEQNIPGTKENDDIISTYAGDGYAIINSDDGNDTIHITDPNRKYSLIGYKGNDTYSIDCNEVNEAIINLYKNYGNDTLTGVKNVTVFNPIKEGLRISSDDWAVNQLKITPDDERFVYTKGTKSGNDLILYLTSGETFTIKDYYSLTSAQRNTLLRMTYRDIDTQYLITKSIESIVHLTDDDGDLIEVPQNENSYEVNDNNKLVVAERDTNFSRSLTISGDNNNVIQMGQNTQYTNIEGSNNTVYVVNTGDDTVNANYNDLYITGGNNTIKASGGNHTNLYMDANLTDENIIYVYSGRNNRIDTSSNSTGLTTLHIKGTDANSISTINSSGYDDIYLEGSKNNVYMYESTQARYVNISEDTVEANIYSLAEAGNFVNTFTALSGFGDESDIMFSHYYNSSANSTTDGVDYINLVAKYDTGVVSATNTSFYGNWESGVFDLDTDAVNSRTLIAAGNSNISVYKNFSEMQQYVDMDKVTNNYTFESGILGLAQDVFVQGTNQNDNYLVSDISALTKQYTISEKGGSDDTLTVTGNNKFRLFFDVDTAGNVKGDLYLFETKGSDAADYDSELDKFLRQGKYQEANYICIKNNNTMASSNIEHIISGNKEINVNDYISDIKASVAGWLTTYNTENGTSYGTVMEAIEGGAGNYSLLKAYTINAQTAWDNNLYNV